MRNRPRLTLELICAALLALCCVLGAVLALLRPVALLALVPALAIIAAALILGGRRLRRSVCRAVTCARFEGSELQLDLGALRLPAALLCGKTLVWYNEAFKARLLAGEDAFLQPVSRVLPGLDLRQCAEEKGQNLERAGRRYTAFSAPGPGAEGYAVLYLVDNTELKTTAAEYAASRPSYLVIEVDGYQELVADLRDSERSHVMEAINRTLEQYFARTNGFLRRVAVSRYIAVVEERHMKEMVAARFDLLDKVRALNEGVQLTLSIGVGRGGSCLKECQQMAEQSLDMALGRGGDQAAVKTPDGFEFYGGVTRSVEKRSRVKSRILANALVDLVRQADSVVIMGHRMSDLDALGAAVGVLRICKGLDVPAVIAVRRKATLATSLIDSFEQAGFAEDFIEPEKAAELVTQNTLLVVVDTHIVNLLESRELYEKCGHVAVIDHHRKAVGHIENPVLFCHEPYASSTCELVCELLQYVPGKETDPTPLEAQALLAGIMLDTRSFALHTGVRTFEAAAYLRRMGAATEEVRSLFNSSLEEYTVKSNLVESARLYMGCAVSVSGELPPGMAVAVPQAANDLLTINGVGASFVAVQKGDGVNISARSMGKVNVQVILEKLGGGGHMTMAGAQLKNISLDHAEQMLCDAIADYRRQQQASLKNQQPAQP
mgnify:CR=1 FL=1